MLGHGVKRKQSCNEAEGLKVYLPEKAEVQAQGGSSYLPHLQQQQLVLSLCLDKLQRSRAELSLHRSVLLVNTLRQIQQDMQRDLPGSLDLSAQDGIWEEDGPLTCPGSSGQPRMANSLGYLMDLSLEDVFEDIDTSMYDSSDIPSALAGYPSWEPGYEGWPVLFWLCRVEIITEHGLDVQMFINDQHCQIIIIIVVVEGATSQ
uniref:SERTA domain-containing protein n=1 Tax=Salmo trutta TaxID=8032 RepID=A0A674C5L5_SALTR